MFRVLIFLLLFVPFSGWAQLNSIGITGGLTLSNQRYHLKIPDITHRSAHRLGFNGSLYTEWGYHHMVTFVSELQYNTKGGAPRVSNDFANGATLLRLLSWNNYLKFRRDGIDGSPYFLIGPRLEYIFASSPAIFGPFVVGASAGVGYEFYFWDRWVPFAEFHYNPSITRSHEDPFTGIRDKAFELKIGIKYRRSGSGGEKCPPVYL